MIFVVLLALGLAESYIQSRPLLRSNFLTQNVEGIVNPVKTNNVINRNAHRLFLSKRSQFMGHPKRRKEFKRPPWYDLFDEEVEKEPLGPPSKLLAPDVIKGERRLRFTLKKTQKQMHATIVDDATSNTLCFMSTNFRRLAPIFGAVPTKEPNVMRNKGGTVKAAYELGKLIGRQALSRGISKVFFDRSGYRYHGRVEALAIGARKVGLDF